MSFGQDCTFPSYIRALIDQSERKLVNESYIGWVIDHRMRILVNGPNIDQVIDHEEQSAT